jgi:1-deoxy-D-xylulose 5-phosphate reductoisomerase
MKNITILGATGSIGDNTLSVAALHPDKFNVFALSAQFLPPLRLGASLCLPKILPEK